MATVTQVTFTEETGQKLKKILLAWIDEIEEMAKTGDEDLSKIDTIIVWVDKYLRRKENDPYSNAGSDGGLNRMQLDYLYKKFNFYDIIDKKVQFLKDKANPEDTVSDPVYSKWSYTIDMGRKKNIDGYQEGLEFHSLTGLLTSTSQLKKVYQAGGVFCTSDDPELSILFSEALAQIIGWAKKETKNTYVNKAVEARKAKISAFYEGLRPVIEKIRSTNEKVTSYRIAAELNKMDISTYSKSGQWMPNMVDRMLKHLEDDKPVMNVTQQKIEKEYQESSIIEAQIEDIPVSPRNAVRRFKQATGVTPTEYLQRTRIEAAKKLLAQTNQNLVEIMLNSGYSDLKSFRELFKKSTGLTPKAYRDKFLEPSAQLENVQP
ncbi:helix-turn-helix domain-containing protein [Dyadobacter sp. CY323]|uniref:helix-turn-helix domain-containing protein n=1 Tax=Dyadobacter sp. CY323 TaxID=2907302 RepID=UPI001F1F5CD8|nr:helix-turn-helix transcriptional regulator [Dyadobacter sp. CY323]MCE6993191.1 helix-turn-helix transcriptional regulator [Dyadobacter sp. CY323]